VTLQTELTLEQVYANRGKILFAGFVFLVALSLRQHEKIARLKEVIAQRPLIQSARREASDKTVKRGPSHKVKVVTTAPDGTKTSTTTTDSGPVETHATALLDERRTETPACAPLRASKTRWGHVTLDPDRLPNPDAVRRMALGLTFWDTLDLGGSYDWRFGAAGLEVGARF
jgi:hypothetical protein